MWVKIYIVITILNYALWILYSISTEFMVRNKFGDRYKNAKFYSSVAERVLALVLAILKTIVNFCIPILHVLNLIGYIFLKEKIEEEVMDKIEEKIVEYERKNQENIS